MRTRGANSLGHTKARVMEYDVQWGDEKGNRGGETCGLEGNEGASGGPRSRVLSYHG